MGVVSYLRLGDATGPIAALSMPASYGQADLYRHINEVMGGIHYKDPRTGRAERVKVNFVEVDTRYDVARGLSSYRRYQGLPKLMLVDPVSTPMVKAILPLLEQDKVVAYATHDGEFDAHPGWGFLWGPPYQDAFAGALTWITKVDWPKKGLARPPVIGYLTWDSPYGRELLRGSTAFADDYGLKLLPPEYYPVGTLDKTPYLTRLKGADYIFFGGVDPDPSNTVRDAVKLGMTKDIQFINDFWGTTTTGVKAYPAELEGTLGYSWYLKGKEAEDSWAGDLYEWSGRGKRTEMHTVYTIGAGLGLYFVEGVRRALNQVGYTALDGAALRKAFEGLAGLETRFTGKEGKWKDVALSGPNAYGPNTRKGSRLMKVYRVKGGAIVPESDWFEAPNAVGRYKW